MTKQNRKHQKSINETETILKQQLNKEDYQEIKNTITSSETATKKLLQQCKFEKFTSMKCKPKSAVKVEGIRTTEEQLRSTKPSFAQALKPNTNTFELRYNIQLDFNLTQQNK